MRPLAQGHGALQTENSCANYLQHSYWSKGLFFLCSSCSLCGIIARPFEGDSEAALTYLVGLYLNRLAV